LAFEDDLRFPFALVELDLPANLDDLEFPGAGVGKVLEMALEDHCVEHVIRILPTKVEELGIAVLGRTELQHLAPHHDLLADVIPGLVGGDDGDVTGWCE
jgi:hypothetical protein